jgi:hypothetical protein
MPVETYRDDEESDRTSLDRLLQAIEVGPVPGNLLDRCLATIPESGARLCARRSPRSGWRRSATAAAAAVFLIGIVVLVVRPRQADAARLLKAVEAAWTEVPRAHSVVVTRRAGSLRRQETWCLRGKGRRDEVRSNDELIAVFVRNPRWDFRWDVRGRIVAAWSTELKASNTGLENDGLLQDSESLLRWAESHRAEINVEPDTLAGRRARKIVLRWPGPPTGGSVSRATTTWFDPDSLRPVKCLVEFDNGESIETQIDYPPPEAMADDLFAFRPPRNVLLEINDPDLGRQVYSEGQSQAAEASPTIPKGAER